MVYFHCIKHYEIRLLLIYRKGIKDDCLPEKQYSKYEVVTDKRTLSVDHSMAQMKKLLEEDSLTDFADAMKIKEIRRASRAVSNPNLPIYFRKRRHCATGAGRRSPTGSKALAASDCHDPQHVLQALNVRGMVMPYRKHSIQNSMQRHSAACLGVCYDP